MKFILVLVSLFVLGQSSPVTLYRETAPGVFIAENITDLYSNYKVNDDDVKIYFRHQNDPDNMIPLDLTNPNEVYNLGFSSQKDTVFIIHGWHNEFDSPVCSEVSEAILQVKDANVFLVDWSAIAKSLYIKAASAVPQIAKIVGSLVTDLVDNNGLDLDKTFVVGHSLGAHISGLVGAAVGGKLNHIVGLDPALPLFEWANIDSRLDPTDAQFVQVIHTCSGLLGFNREIGDVDYWPNGGSGQPGCGGLLDIGGTCSHGRSYLYFAESVISGGFIARQCDSYNDFKNGKCDSAPSSLMGEYIPDRQATGSYYLNTNEASPFAQH